MIPAVFFQSVLAFSCSTKLFFKPPVIGFFMVFTVRIFHVIPLVTVFKIYYSSYIEVIGGISYSVLIFAEQGLKLCRGLSMLLSFNQAMAGFYECKRSD